LSQLLGAFCPRLRLVGARLGFVEALGDAIEGLRRSALGFGESRQGLVVQIA
jgi:hypothetical protein